MTTKDQSGIDLMESGKLHALRQLILGLDQQDQDRLHLLLRDPHAFADEISELLPYAVRRLVEKGEITVDSLMPIIEDSMHKSVQKNPGKLVDILFPVMGPAIRKAVSEDIKRLIASINTSIETGLSFKSLKWRIQALLSKRSYTEILLANTYLYHVSHVFLIHRQSGILLHQEAANDSQQLESNMISAMITAIRDFVSDSFHNREDTSLDTIQVGLMNIFIEQGPHAIIAAIVEGNPPADFRLTMTEAIEAIHFNMAPEIEKFDGDTAIFIHSSKFLRTCLIRERKQRKARPPLAFIGLLILLFILISWVGYGYITNRRQIRALQEQVNNTPGYHLSSVKKKAGKYWFIGLQDPDATPFNEIVASSTIDSNKVKGEFEAYLSLEPEILVRKALNRLQPPPTVFLKTQGTVLEVTGAANQDWVEKLWANIFKITGISELDDSKLRVNHTEEPDLDWIIPEIEQKSFEFDINITEIDSLQFNAFQDLVQAALLLEQYNQTHHTLLRIIVYSYTSHDGNVEANLRVALRRAEHFATLLYQAGLKEELLEAHVKFVEEGQSPSLIRSVQFKVIDKNKE